MKGRVEIAGAKMLREFK